MGESSSAGLGGTGPEPQISIIVPVLNEGAVIASLISHLEGLPPDPTREIIVVDGDPSGSTIRAFKEGPVTTLLAPAGRSTQMNRGAAAAKGSTLLFLHADTRLPANGLILIDEALANPSLVAGAFDLGIDSPRLVFRFIERVASLRSRFTRVPFGDQAPFFRRSYFFEIGGFKPISIMEDVEVMRRIRKRHDRIAIIPARVRTSARRWETEGILRCTLRNWLLQVLYCFGVTPGRLARYYRSP